jgi:hypothetical protein
VYRFILFICFAHCSVPSFYSLWLQRLFVAFPAFYYHLVQKRFAVAVVVVQVGLAVVSADFAATVSEVQLAFVVVADYSAPDSVFLFAVDFVATVSGDQLVFVADYSAPDFVYPFAVDFVATVSGGQLAFVADYSAPDFVYPFAVDFAETVSDDRLAFVVVADYFAPDFAYPFAVDFVATVSGGQLVLVADYSAPDFVYPFAVDFAETVSDVRLAFGVAIVAAPCGCFL